MNSTLDLRVQKTYSALITAFLNLLERKRFEDITVNEICNNAMVRRATFYKHFYDKYDFFSFVIRNIQDDFCEKRKKANVLGDTTYIAIVKDVLDFLDENERLVQSVLKSDLLSVLLDIISVQMVSEVKTLFEETASGGKKLAMDSELLAQAFVGAFISLARWWITNKKTVNKERMIEEISVLIDKILV